MFISAVWCNYHDLFVSAPGEKDMIVMHHNIGVTWADNSQEKRVINFVCYGEDNGYSAMAKTVGLPTAIATKMILDGKLVIF
jgi:saccharopine dehydrogenase-like NADP-dependent oxidoreductase